MCNRKREIRETDSVYGRLKKKINKALEKNNPFCHVNSIWFIELFFENNLYFVRITLIHSQREQSVSFFKRKITIIYISFYGHFKYLCFFFTQIIQLIALSARCNSIVREPLQFISHLQR